MATQPLTLLIHGLHQNQYVLYPLSRHLKRAGFHTKSYGYASLKHSLQTNSQHLHEWLSAYHPSNLPINLVAHSLGGLIIRHFTHNYPQWRIHRCVTLGTPHQGSICANYVKYYLPFLVGNSYLGALDGTCPPLPDNISLGVIAGSKPLGIGSAFLFYHNQKYKHSPAVISGIHDGAVYLAETPLPNMTDYIVLPVTHAQLLTSQSVAKQVVHFLTYGKFTR